MIIFYPLRKELKCSPVTQQSRYSGLRLAQQTSREAIMTHEPNDTCFVESQDTEDYSAPQQTSADRLTSCMRCDGLLTKEFCFDLHDETGENWFWALRCLQCGEVIDPVIVRNRLAEQPFQFKNRSRRKEPISTANF